jgi:hypothetical protein
MKLHRGGDRTLACTTRLIRLSHLVTLIVSVSIGACAKKPPPAAPPPGPPPFIGTAPPEPISTPGVRFAFDPDFIRNRYRSADLALVLPLLVDERQVRARRRLDARGLRQFRQEVLVTLARVAPDDAAQRRVGLQRRRVDADRFAADQSGIRQSLQYPGEDRLVRLEIVSISFRDCSWTATL